MRDTRTREFKSADYMRGLTILVVIINHYVNTFISAKYLGFGHTAVGLFFILSGYGIWHSLDRHMKPGKNIFLSIASFYIRRILRIYPLFLISFISYIFLFNDDNFKLSFEILNPFIILPGLFWYISMLIQCYIFAPFLFLLQNKFTDKWLFLLIASIVMLYVIFNNRAINYAFLKNITYLNIIFGHFMLFALGMTIPTSLDTIRRSFWKQEALVPLLFLLFTSSYFAARQGKDPIYSYIYIVMCYILVLFVLSFNSKFPFESFVSAVGKLSYPLYLIHLIYFLLCKRIQGIVGSNFIVSILPIIFSPIIYYFAYFVEKNLNITHRRQKLN